MRLYALILFCGFLIATCAEPEPKKYKAQTKEKTKHSNTTLTADEKKFLRDVEAKFGIQNEATKEEKKNTHTTETNTTETVTGPSIQPGHFPAVIAIEIVNDTDTKTKGKRTIDANLGYGYKTNNGYTYSYFGKSSQEKGKFMIYPYSQSETPAGTVQTYQSTHHYEKPNIKTSVEIQPSQAFELVKVKDEQSAYKYEKPEIEFKTPSPHTHVSSSYTSHPSTLYTTYNGGQFSGLSGQFPSVMQNYLVDPSQLLNNPEYQSVGLTQDHLRSSHIEQKVVPVLVLRIPSSSLTNPTAELYANLPQNYPLSNYLNNLNLQELVNQYFKKNGYSFAPQVMTYSSPLSSSGVESSVGNSASHTSMYAPQHYAHPYVQPSYTQSHSSGVQYSAVQPVMAKYPSSYTRHHYSIPKGHSLYKQPSLSQKYEYQYQYVPHSAISSQKYYTPSAHYHQQTQHVGLEQLQSAHALLGADNTDTNSHIQYESPGHLANGYESSVSHDAKHASPQVSIAAEYTGNGAQSAAEYGAPQVNSETEYATSQAHVGKEYTISQGHVGSEYTAGQAQVNAEYDTPQTHYQVEYDNSNAVASEYGVPKDGNSQSLPAGYESSVTASPSSYGSTENSHVISQEYYIQNNQQTEQESHSSYPSQIAPSQTSQIDSNGHQNYVYEHQSQDSGDHGLVLTENYPTKDHTIAAVYPTQYKTGKQHSPMVQTVSYVTPLPHPKYRIPYQVMVPQTYLHNPTSEKVTYVHSQPLSVSYSQSGHSQNYNAGGEYTPGYNSHQYHYTVPSKHKGASYPRSYHSHPKRMVHRNEKSDSRNKNDKNEKKKMS